MTITVNNLIESAHYNIDMDITTKSVLTEKEVEILNTTVDKFLILNNTQYEHLFRDYYLKIFSENLQEKISTKISEVKVYDTIKKTKKVQQF